MILWTGLGPTLKSYIRTSSMLGWWNKHALPGLLSLRLHINVSRPFSNKCVPSAPRSCIPINMDWHSHLHRKSYYVDQNLFNWWQGVMLVCPLGQGVSVIIAIITCRKKNISNSFKFLLESLLLKILSAYSQVTKQELFSVALLRKCLIIFFFGDVCL